MVKKEKKSANRSLKLPNTDSHYLQPQSIGSRKLVKHFDRTKFAQFNGVILFMSVSLKKPSGKEHGNVAKSIVIAELSPHLWPNVGGKNFVLECQVTEEETAPQLPAL